MTTPPPKVSRIIWIAPYVLYDFYKIKHSVHLSPIHHDKVQLQLHIRDLITLFSLFHVIF